MPPLLAPPVEARMGTLVHANDNRLRLDAGNSVDLIRFHVSGCPAERLTLGADFFTYTSLRAQQNFHFPVDAVDYLFGANVSYALDCGALAYQGRLRISHISAHLVDGRYDKSSSLWIEGQLPRVYSREFFDLLGALDAGWVRGYAGAQYLFHVDPPDLPRWSWQAGIECARRELFAAPVHLYAAYDLRLVSIRAYTAAHALQAGVKFGAWRGRGLDVYLAYYNGMNYHGEFYDQRAEYWGPGLSVEF